jgi:hypothetical protein
MTSLLNAARSADALDGSPGAAGGILPLARKYQLTNESLDARCRQATRSGLDFFYSLVDSPDDELRDRAVELLGLVEKDEVRKKWTMEWVASHDPSDKVRKLSANLAEMIFGPAYGENS